jgi:hypothetical protein
VSLLRCLLCIGHQAVSLLARHGGGVVVLSAVSVCLSTPPTAVASGSAGIPHRSSRTWPNADRIEERHRRAYTVLNRLPLVKITFRKEDT